MGLEMRLLARLEQQPEDFYASQPEYTTEVLGEEVKYVLCSEAQFNRWGTPTKLGRADDGKVYVARTLHPAQVPFVALRLFYEGLSARELEERLGQETIRGVSQKQIRKLIAQTTLDLARGYLRAPEMADLIERQKTEQDYDPLQDAEMLTAIATRPQNTAIEAIAQQHKASLEHYIATMQKYFNAHAKNKYVKGSRRMLAAAKSNPWIDRNMDGYIIPADRVLDEILQDETLAEQIPELAQATTQLAQIEQPLEVHADAALSRLFYLCQQATEGRGKRKILAFKQSDTPGENNVLIIPRAAMFFRALNTRLCSIVMEERRAIEEARERIEGPSYRALLVANVETQQEAVPQPYSEEVQGTLQQGVVELSLVATAAANDNLRVAKALQAREILSLLGLPTREVDNLIAAQQKADQQQIARAAPPRLLG